MMQRVPTCDTTGPHLRRKERRSLTRCIGGQPGGLLRRNLRWEEARCLVKVVTSLMVNIVIGTITGVITSEWYGGLENP
jgi:hypothetical protein